MTSFGLRPPIRGVLFDVDGTLYRQPPLRIAMACEMMVTRCWSICTRRPDGIERALSFRRTREQLRAGGHDGVSLERRQYVHAAAVFGCTAEDMHLAVDEWIYRRPLKWVRACRRRGLDDLLRFLQQHRIRCGVFSDYPAGSKLHALGLAGRFDLELSAVDAEISAFKPDPKGFLVASRCWGLDPREVLYVGDRVDVDAEGAAAAGMQCAVIGGRRRGRETGFLAVAGFKELQRALDMVC
jgi:FMN phosphatase YigB (HAD superfamily)